MDEENTFDCGGKVTPTDAHVSRSSLLNRPNLNPILFPPSLTIATFSVSTPRLFGSPQPAATGILHVKHWIKLMEMQIRMLNRFENCQEVIQSHQQIDYYHLRKEILDFVIYIRTYFHSIHPHLPHLQHPLIAELKTGFDEVLLSLRKFLSRLKNLSLHYTCSNTGNKCPQPAFHLFHLHLELRWLMITLIHQQTLQEDSQHDQLDRTLELFIQDLIFISLKTFQPIDLSDLRLKSPFSCSCLRDLWLILQITIDKTSDKLAIRNFWNYVNSTLDRIMIYNGGKSSSDEVEELSWSSARGHKSNYKFDTKSPEIFCLWMIYHITLLYNYSEVGNYTESLSSPRLQCNSQQLEKILKSFLDKGGKEGERDEIDEELRTMIPLFKCLILDFRRERESSIKIISLLWDCFHRRLDQPFLVQTAGPWSILLDKKSPREILKQIKERIWGDNPNESSFGMFLKLLGIILKENYEKKELKVWNQIRGRVYSKFSKSKVQEFSEVRLFNLISLLLTMGAIADAESVVKVMVDLLPNPLDESDDESGRRISLSFKAQLCCLILLMENGLELGGIGEKLMGIVGVLSTRRDELARSMMTMFVETLSEEFSKVQLLENGQHHLMGGWIDRYLLECPKNRAGTMLKMLSDLLNKSRALDIANIAGGKDMLAALWASAAARVRALVYDNDLTDENCDDIGKIAATFTIEALRCPKMAESQKHSALSLFRHFTSTIYVKNVKISRIYLTIILENRGAVSDMKKLVNTFDLVIIQVWIKCSMFGMDSSPQEMKTIKNYVVDQDEMRKIFPSWRDSLDFKNSKESLILFVNAINRHRATLSEAERIHLDQRFRHMFLGLDKWALQPIKEDNKDSAICFFIYRCLGTIILNCAPMLYTTPPTLNTLRILITKFMLPPDNNSHLKYLGKKIFSMIILGLESLNPRDDQILQPIIIDLFNIYLPLLITRHHDTTRRFMVADQLINMFKEINDNFLQYIFDKLCANYLIIENNELRQNSYLLMELLRALLREGGGRRGLAEVIGGSVLKRVVEGFLRVHDVHPHRRQTMELIRDLCDNEFYRVDIVKEMLCGVICARVREMTKGCFEFLRGLVRLRMDSEVLQAIVQQLERLVGEAEKGARIYAGALRYALKQFNEFWLENYDKHIDKL